jgi:hypothetical protein
VRASEFLEEAFTILQEQAARIPDEDERRHFLGAVPWHREIVAKCEARRA